MKINPLTAIDFYKADHRRQYPAGTSLVYSNFTPRSAKLSPIPEHLFDGKVVNFGLQFFIKDYLIGCWNEGFFQKPKQEVITQYKRRMDYALGKGAIPVDHIESLHDLGYLPISIKALPEGTRSPIKVPVLTICNTKPEFFWLTNYLETVLSNSLWKPMTSATIAYAYKRLLNYYTAKGDSFVNFQAHDFSCRGMSNMQDAALSGAAHLTSFVGTDTVQAIDLLEDYYCGDSDGEMLGASVPATEHSVMCMGGQDDEIGTIRRLITQLYPAGIVSIVSDSWDFWRVITEYTKVLKPEIMARPGKVVFRPDSGDPVKIIVGDPEASPGTPQHRGAVGCLWDIFGGTTNGFRSSSLDSHVGLIYGDSITLERAEAILKGLSNKKFSSESIVFGVGSFTYQYVTRDSFGFAVKSTYGEINGEPREIFKDPKTDNGIKKSLRGLIRVDVINGDYEVFDHQTKEQAAGGCLREVFRDGMLLVNDSISMIRKRLRNEI